MTESLYFLIFSFNFPALWNTGNTQLSGTEIFENSSVVILPHRLSDSNWDSCSQNKGLILIVFMTSTVNYNSALTQS